MLSQVWADKLCKRHDVSKSKLQNGGAHQNCCLWSFAVILLLFSIFVPAKLVCIAVVLSLDIDRLDMNMATCYVQSGISQVCRDSWKTAKWQALALTQRNDFARKCRPPRLIQYLNTGKDPLKSWSCSGIYAPKALLQVLSFHCKIALYDRNFQFVVLLAFPSKLVASLCS